MLCNLPLCCRAVNGYPTETWLQAGKWGAYLCDLPEATMRNMLQYIKANFNPAFIFWTGDNVAHNGWESSEAEVIEANQNTTDIIVEELDGLDFTMYPIQGNHDVFPVNVQDFSKPNPAIIANSKAWSRWLDADSIKQYKKYGYYSQPLKFANGTQVGNTFVIALNTGVCNLYNLYLMRQHYDPGEQITWLE